MANRGKVDQLQLHGFQPYLLLLVLFIIGLLGKNQSIMVAVTILFTLRITNLDRWLFEPLQKNGIQWGVTLLMVGVLVPIASGEIGYLHLWQSLRSQVGIMGLISGMIVAIVPIWGIDLLKNDPELTTSLVVGTILAVSLFKGIPVGPLIGAGITALLIKGSNLILHLFK